MAKRKVIHDTISVEKGPPSSPDLTPRHSQQTKSSPTPSDEKETEVDPRAFPHALSLVDKTRELHIRMQTSVPSALPKIQENIFASHSRISLKIPHAS